MEETDADAWSMDSLTSYLLDLSVEKTELLVSHGARICVLVQGAGDVLYIPMGWIVAERARSGALIYGMRCGTVCGQPEALMQMETTLKLLKADGRDTSKSELVYKQLAGEEAAAAKDAAQRAESKELEEAARRQMAADGVENEAASEAAVQS